MIMPGTRAASRATAIVMSRGALNDVACRLIMSVVKGVKSRDPLTQDTNIGMF